MKYSGTGLALLSVLDSFGEYHPKATRLLTSNGEDNSLIDTGLYLWWLSCVSGDFASAIETLVTAISLIKQSKIASDDRCKILISSLQDTLHGIEEKSYGARYCPFFVCLHILTQMAPESLCVCVCVHRKRFLGNCWSHHHQTWHGSSLRHGDASRVNYIDFDLHSGSHRSWK